MLKIDYSTIALILLLVVPGLVAKKSRRRISAQSFTTNGPATELGELVGLSLAIHLLLLFGFIAAVVIFGTLSSHSAFSTLETLDKVDYLSWEGKHLFEAVFCLSLYLLLSVLVAYCLGIMSGWWQLNQPFLRWVESKPRPAALLQRFKIYSLLEERPLSFELFTGESVARKTDLIYFLEVKLRDGEGYITGELNKYAITRDEEAHRPVVLRDAQFKKAVDDLYSPMAGDRVLVDLADALLVQVSYREREKAMAEVEFDQKGTESAPEV